LIDITEREAPGELKDKLRVVVVSRKTNCEFWSEERHMNTVIKTLLLGAICATSTLLSVATASAVPNVAAATVASGQLGTLEEIQYRGNYRGGRNGIYNNGYRNRGSGYRRNNGRNIGIGIGAAIIGGIILNEAARAEHRSANGSQWERCAQTYRSFEPSTGMYTGYDGERRTCPYLN
jgi:opacity protein-like surface antigen